MEPLVARCKERRESRHIVKRWCLRYHRTLIGTRRFVVLPTKAVLADVSVVCPALCTYDNSPTRLSYVHSAGAHNGHAAATRDRLKIAEYASQSLNGYKCVPISAKAHSWLGKLTMAFLGQLASPAGGRAPGVTAH